MRYSALLRGVNVGGKSVVRMVDLKTAMEKCGFSRVQTIIQSGNLIFESEVPDNRKLERAIEACLEKEFQIKSMAVVLDRSQLEKVIANMPDAWQEGDNLRQYIAFIKPPATVQSVMTALKPREGVDSASQGDGVVYMSTILTELSKSGFTRIIDTAAYKDITIRNSKTVRKILAALND